MESTGAVGSRIRCGAARRGIGRRRRACGDDGDRVRSPHIRLPASGATSDTRVSAGHGRHRHEDRRLRDGTWRANAAAIHHRSRACPPGCRQSCPGGNLDTRRAGGAERRVARLAPPAAIGDRRRGCRRGHRQRLGASAECGGAWQQAKPAAADADRAEHAAFLRQPGSRAARLRHVAGITAGRSLAGRVSRAQDDRLLLRGAARVAVVVGEARLGDRGGGPRQRNGIRRRRQGPALDDHDWRPAEADVLAR